MRIIELSTVHVARFIIEIKMEGIRATRRKALNVICSLQAGKIILVIE